VLHTKENLMTLKRTLATGAAAGTAILAGLSGLSGGAGDSVGNVSAHPSTAGAVHAAANSTTLQLHPSSGDLDECFPHARARVTVDLTTDAIGKDTFDIRAWGLKHRTDFTIFLVQKAASPFGAVEYIGDMTTNRYGQAHNRFQLIAEEAFAFNNETQVRKELNSVGFWFADPKDDNGCLGAGSPVTQFDGDRSAGVQMMNSGAHKLP
jgi:hypothetical protein